MARALVVIATAYGVMTAASALGQGRGHELACDSFGPGVRGICIAYCNQCFQGHAKDCDPHDEDCNRQNCVVLLAKFRDRTGGSEPPCDLALTPTATSTATFTPIFTATATSTATGTATETSLPSETPTETPIPTATETGIFTATATSMPEGTATETPTPTATETATAIVTFTATSAAAGFVEEKSAKLRSFEAQLSGDNEVPSVMTTAEGHARLQLSNEKPLLRYRLHVEQIQDVTQAHIHCGAPGVNGPVAAFLFGPFPSGIDPRRRLASGVVTAAEVIPVPDSTQCPGGIDSFDALVAKIRAGETYVNVHTLAHPSGEIRGQIEPR